MSLHVMSGHLTLVLDAGREEAHEEIEIQFAKPVNRVVVTLSGFELIPADDSIKGVG